MTASHSAATPRPGRRLLVSLSSTVLLVSGCSNMVSTAPSSFGGNSAAATLGGHVHGGNQPVAGATVNLYFAGQSGLPSAATLVATTQTLDDGYGSFSFVRAADGGQVSGTTNTFSCPTNFGTPYVYVVARGGNTLNTHDSSVSNNASVFIAPMGLCNQLSSSTFVSMSEAVTAATVAAVHQYMNVATGDIGADGILNSYDGLANSFNTVSNMVNLATGQTIASIPITGASPGVTVTATPEQAKLDQIANILSSCVNTKTGASGSGSLLPPNACDTLFASAVPPVNPATTSVPNASFTPATDVLQAAYYMFTNSTDTTSSDTTAANRTKLYNLSSGTSAPYQPTLAAVPSDWSIGIRYSALGDCGTGNNSFISTAYDLNVDGTGNIWIANNQLGGSSLSEISATGIPMSCLAIGGASLGGTIDSSGNIWVGDSENSILYRYDPTGKNATLQFPTTAPPFALAADGAGNVYFSSLPQTSINTPLSVTSPASVWKISGAASATVAVPPVVISNDVSSTPARILVDANGSIWASTRDAFVSLISPATTGSNLLNGYTTTHVATPTPSYGLAVTGNLGGNNSIFVSSQEGSNTIEKLTGSGVNYSTANGFVSASNAGGLNVPSAIAIDGAQNVWAANDQPDTDTNQGSVTELTTSGVSLSADGAAAGGYQKDPGSFVHGRTIAIDQSGNVWIGNDGDPAITEIVGGAVPIFQPFAIGLSNNRFQTKP